MDSCRTGPNVAPLDTKTSGGSWICRWGSPEGLYRSPLWALSDWAREGILGTKLPEAEAFSLNFTLILDFFSIHLRVFSQGVPNGRCRNRKLQGANSVDVWLEIEFYKVDSERELRTRMPMYSQIAVGC